MLMMVIGLLGIMAVQKTAANSNQTAARLDRARMVAEQSMEELRGRDPTTLTDGSYTLADQLSPDLVVYHRSYTISTMTGYPNLAMISMDVTFGEQGDESDLHHVKLQLMRTRVEKF